MVYSRALAGGCSRALVGCSLIVFVLGLFVVACDGDDTDQEGVDGSAVTDEDTGEDTATSYTPDLVAEDGWLRDVCPDPFVVQTDWFPESEHGALYNLIGDEYELDTDSKVVRGPMTLDGVDLGITFEVRAGGPAIGNNPVSTHMYIDDSIHLGYASTDSQILRWDDAPLLSVVATLEKNPQMIMWDPETYPEIETLADLGAEGVVINVFPPALYPDVFAAEGIWSADQIDRSYDGSPGRFIAADGAIAQQGFASSEVYTYEHIHEKWGRPVKFELLHDAGFQVYVQTMGVRPDQLETLSPCLERLVPVIQQSIVSYTSMPSRANEMIVDVVSQLDSFWKYQPELADFSVRTQRELGLVGNGTDDIVGNIEDSRVQGVLDAILETEIADRVSEDFTINDLYTNDFIDTSIGF